LVAENGKDVNPAARKVEASVLEAMVTTARAEDSFAMLTSGGRRKELRFGTPRDALLSDIHELSSPSAGKSQGNSALDAVLEAGGFFVEENTEGDAQKRYQLTDELLRVLNKRAGQLYKAIVEYYGIRLAAAPKGFAVDLTDALRQQLPAARVNYPREMPRCSGGSGVNPSPDRP